VANNSSYLPYQINATLYPTTSQLPNVTDNSSWGRTTSSSIGTSSFFSQVYVDTDLAGNHSLDYRTGSYNTSLAGTLASHSACTSACAWDLPILWTAPTLVVALGPSSVVGDALAAVNSTVAVAISYGGGSHSTAVYYSPSLGAPGTWIGATGGIPVTGGSPNITLQPCKGILLTTLTSANLVATTFPFSCTNSLALAPPAPPPSGGGPTVTSISPAFGTLGTPVNVIGTGFTSGASVAFGPNPSTSVSYLSSTHLIAQAPVGKGVVDVVVTVGTQSSPPVPADEFGYTGARWWPTVTSVTPNTGLPFSNVTVRGTNFSGNFSTTSFVQFGTVHSNAVQLISTTQLNVSVPPGTGAVNVRVTTLNGTSNVTAGDEYTYSTPTVSRLAPPTGYPTASAYIFGNSFAPGATVYFGPYMSPASTTVSAHEIRSTIPWGNGTGNVVVKNPGGSQSVLVVGDHFSWVSVPLLTSRSTTDLPLAASAQPVWTAAAPGFNGTLGIIAANISTSTIIFYHSTQVGHGFGVSLISSYSTKTAPSDFPFLGETRWETPGGPAGAVTGAAEGPDIIALYTTRLENRTILESSASDNYGVSWGESYTASSIVGSLANPDVAGSPAGYYYATWQDNGAGPWQVDTQEFTPTGRPLQGVTAIPGSQGSAGAQFPSVAVDGLERPLFTWTAVNSTGTTEIFGTGAFLSPRHSVSQLWAALNSTSSSDYLAGETSAAISTYDSKLGTNLSLVASDVATGSICNAEKVASGRVYPYSGWALALSSHNTTSTCDNFARVHPPQLMVVNETGPVTANFSLAVLSQWLLESVGFGIFSTPAWTSIVPVGSTASPVPFSGGGSSTDGSDSLGVQTQGVNPQTVLLNTTWVFRSVSASTRTITAYCSGINPGVIEYTYTNTDSPLNFSTQIWLNSSAHDTYVSNGSLLGVYLTNLTPNSLGTWNVKVTATYQQTYLEEVNSCRGAGSVIASRTVSIRSGWPVNPSLSTSGAYSTYFGYAPGSPTLNISNETGRPGRDQVQLNWTNSLLALDSVALLNRTSPTHGTVNSTSNAAYSAAERFAMNDVAIGDPYTLYENATSMAGGASGGWGVTYNASQSSGTAAADQAAASCSFTASANPLSMAWTASTNITGVTATTAVLTWSANKAGNGWVHYEEQYGSWQYAAATEFPANSTNFYRADLKGLTPWGFYTAVVGVTTSAASSCVAYSKAATWTFQTAAKFSLTEQDLPYDSITEQGGGASLYWDEPYYFVPRATFLNGTGIYYPVNPLNTSDVVSVPISSPSVLEPCAYCFELNVSTLVVNTTYTVTLILNYTYGSVVIHASNLPFSFWYEGDSSGDGLTNWEKVRGWEVTTQGATGSVQNQWVSANPAPFATNGLTSDYEEKEFGLNPNTVDSSGSHMLDTWNLTFYLGPKSAPLAVPRLANFEYFYSAGNTSADYNWTRACQYFVPAGSIPACVKGAINSSPWSNLTGVDSWAWASRTLWSRLALSSFINFSGVKSAGWLRATVGNSSTFWTLTVWGKLSWGANPLAASTPRDGIPDGARVNPLYDEDLLVGGLSASLTSCPTPPGSDEFGWAPLLYLNWSASGGPHILPSGGNFTAQALVSKPGGTLSCGSISGYQVPIPFNGTSQNLSLQIRIILNASTSTSGTVPIAEPFAAGSSPTIASISYDVSTGRSRSYSYSGSNGSLGLSLSVVPAGVKAPTYLWQAADNGTMNQLPWGLKRYTGEQAFDLVVLNQTNSYTLSSRGIPYAQNSSRQYVMSLPSGLNNILVPRGQFLDSVLGQSMLLGEVPAWVNWSKAPPLLGPSENSTIGTFGGSNPMKNLSCYWQNRAIGWTGGSSTPICSSEAGTTNGSSNSVSVIAQTGGAGMNSGGLPDDPTLENLSSAGAAIQSIVTLNLTSNTTWDLFIAALMDNTTAGVNGTFQSVTYEVPNIGFAAGVTDALANVSLTSGGLFGMPWGYDPPQPKQASGIWALVTNTVSGIVHLGAALLSVAWSATLAVAHFIDNHLPTWLKNLGATLVARTVAGLETIGRVLADALSAFVTWLIQQITAILQPIFAPLKAAFTAYGSGVYSAYLTANSTVNPPGGHPPGPPPPSGGLTVAEINNYWLAATHVIFDGALVLGVAVLAALLILDDVVPGEGILTNILITVVVAGAIYLGSAVWAHTPSLAGFGYGLEQGVLSLISSRINATCYGPETGTLGDLFQIPTDSFVSIMDLGLVAAAYIIPMPKGADYDPAEYIVDLILDVMGVTMDLLSATAYAAHNYAASFLEAVMGVIFGAKAVYDLLFGALFSEANDFIPGLKGFELLSDSLGSISEATGVIEITSTC
jgi:hypothetical protein